MGQLAAAPQQRVFIYFADQPPQSLLDQLGALGVTVYANSWIPPLKNHPAGFLLADIPVDRLSDVAAISAVVSLNTAEVQLRPLNDQAAVATNVDDVWGEGYDGTGVTVAVLDSGFEKGHPDFPSMTAGTDYKDYSSYPTLDNTVANIVTGHGTHVAGTAIGRGTQSASGIYRGAAYAATPKLLNPSLPPC